MCSELYNMSRFQKEIVQSKLSGMKYNKVRNKNKQTTIQGSAVVADFGPDNYPQD